MLLAVPSGKMATGVVRASPNAARQISLGHERCTDKEGAGQFAVFTDERCVVAAYGTKQTCSIALTNVRFWGQSGQ